MNKQNSGFSSPKSQQVVQFVFNFQAKWVDAYTLREILKISRTTLYQLERLGLLSVCKLGNKKYYDLVGLDRLMESTKLPLTSTIIQKITRELKKPQKSKR